MTYAKEAEELKREILSNVAALPESPVISHAISGSIDAYVASEVCKRLEGKSEVTMADIRRVRNEILCGR